MANKITFGVGFNIDKTGLNELTNQLKDIKNLTQKDLIKIDVNNGKKELEAVKYVANEVEYALKQAFSPSINAVDLKLFNQHLKYSDLNLQEIYDKLKIAGAQGEATFRSLALNISNANTQFKKTETILDKIGQTLANTIRWNLSSSVVNQLSGSMQEAYGYVKHLDSTLNDIRIVTGKSADEMDKFAQKANIAAQSLGKSTTDYTEAALIYAQQGLGDEEIAARTEVTLKAANVTGQNAAQVSEQLTAVWNGFQVTAENTERSVDRLAAIAASSASDLEELSTGMSKVASAAYAMGVSEDQLAAMLSTVISVTRAAPESIGVAFKTIFARVTDIQQGLDDEFASLGNYSGKIAEFGINILDAKGNLRDMGDVIEEVGNKWETMNREQQINLAQTMAGQRQYSNLMALFENWDMYQDMMDVAANSAGTLQKQQDVYMESTAAHLEQMRTAIENLYDSFLDNDSINVFADTVANVSNTLAGFFDSIGGGETALLHFGAIGAKVFSEQIGSSVAKMVGNFQMSLGTNNQNDIQNIKDQIIDLEGMDEATKQLIKSQQELSANKDLFSPDMYNTLQDAIYTLNDMKTTRDKYNESIKQGNELLKEHQIYSVNTLEDIANADIEKIESFAESVQQALVDTNEALDVVIKKAKEGVQEIGQIFDIIPEGERDEWLSLYVDEFEKVKDEAMKLATVYQEEFTGKELDALQESINGFADSTKSTEEKLQSLAIVFDLLKKHSEKLKQENKEVSQTFEELGENAQGVKHALSNDENINSLENSLNNIFDITRIKQAVVQFSQFAGAIGQISASFQTLANIPKIWSDENLSGIEKLIKTITALGIVIPQILNGITTLNTVFSAMTAASTADTAATTANTASKTANATASGASAAAKTAETKATTANTGAKTVNTVASGKSVAATGAETAANLTNTKATLAESASITANTIVKNLNTIATKAYTIATKAATIATQLFNAALAALGGPIGIIVAAIGGLIVAWNVFKNMDTRTNAEKALDNVNKKVEETEETLKRVKNKIDEITSKLSSLENANDAFENLEKGTADWYKQLQEVNEIVLDLIDNYPELLSKGYVTRNEDGILGLSDEGKEYIKEQQNKDYAQAANANIFAEAEQRSLQRETALDNLYKVLTNIPLDKLNMDYADIANKIEQLYQTNGQGILTNESIKQLSELIFKNPSEDNYESLQNVLKQFVNDYGEGQSKALSEDIKNQQALQNILIQLGAKVDSADFEKLTGKSSADVIDNAIASASNKINTNFKSMMEDAKKNNASDERKYLEDYIRAQGGDVDSLEFGWDKIGVQRIQFEVDGQSKTLAEDEIKDVFRTALINETANADVQSSIQEYLTKNIEGVNIDELGQSFQNTLFQAASRAEELGFDGPNLINGLISKLGEDFDESSFTQMFNDMFQNIPDGTKIKQLTEDFNNNKISIDELTESIKRFNTEGMMENLNFEQFAKDSGFSESDADYFSALMQQIFEDASEGVNGFNKNVAETPELLKEVTKEIARLQRGYKNLYDNMDKWIEAMDEGGRDSVDAINNIRDAVADILDVDLSEIDASFVVDNLDAIKRAASGSEEAVKELEFALFEITGRNILIELGLNTEQFQQDLTDIAQQIFEYEANNEVEIGTYLEKEPFIDALNDLVDATGMSAGQLQSMLSKIGYEPSYVEKNVEQKQTMSTTDITQHVEKSGELSFGENGQDTYIGYQVRTTFEPHTEETVGGMDLLGFKDTSDGKAPEIKGLTKTASGSGSSKLPSSYKPSAPSSSGSGGGGGKKPSGGKGSGGGSGSTKDPKQKDLLEEEADRYHDINIELQNINRDLDRLADVQKKLTGRDLINNLNKQLEILEKQVDAYKRKVEIAKVELAENKIALGQLGVTFDENGQISNYIEAYQAALKKYNDAVTAYNLMSAEEQEATGEAAIELAKKEFDKFKEKLDRYDELINEVIPDLEDNIQEAINKQIELNIEKFKMEIEVRLDMADAERSWNEFKKKVIDGIKDDDFLGIIKSQYADLLTYFNTAETGKGPIQALTEQLNGTLEQLKSMDGTLGDWASAYGDDRASALEDLQEYLDELMNQMMDVEDLVKDIEDTYLDMIDSIKDAFDEQLDNYELIDDIIEHNKNVIELLYGEDAYDQMAQYYDKQEQNNLQQLDFLRQEANFWREKMDAEEQGSEAWKQYKENWEDAIGNLNDQVETSIETLIDKYANLIDSVFDKLNDKVSGGLGLDYISDEWDLINKNADEYLDTINRAYETQKLQDKFNEALANNSGLKAQQQIKDLMDQQLGDLTQRDKLTQYDVERAEKLLDIELKKIALQDAQQNKSKMRLRRDAQGNYSYQFVSDEQQIKDAQKELADAQNELYNFDKDRYKDNLNKIYDTYNEFQEKLKELYADTTLSEEERERKRVLLIQQYNELITGLTEQNAQIRLNLEDSAFTELAKMYNTNVEEFKAMTEEQRNALLEGLLPYWNSGIQEMVNTFAGEGGFIPTCSESFDILDEATKGFIDGLEEIEAAADINFGALAEGYDKNIDLAQQLIVKNDQLISQYDRELQAVRDVLSAVRELASEYAMVKQNAIEASEAAMKYAQEEAKRKAEAAEAEKKKQEALNNATSSNNSSSSNNNSNNSSNSSSSTPTADSGSKKVTLDNIKAGDKVRYLGGMYYWDSDGTSPMGNRGPGKVVTVQRVYPQGKKYKVAVTSTDSAYGWLNVDQLEKLKSGGYTGDWGDSGKLAVLHQKELVLNEKDTKNILNAVDILRGLSDILGAKTLDNLSSTLEKINITPIAEKKEEVEILEQEVTINATFPNVKNSNEVEEAINNLINTAAQRRNRRRR